MTDFTQMVANWYENTEAGQKRLNRLHDLPDQFASALQQDVREMFAKAEHPKDDTDFDPFRAVMQMQDKNNGQKEDGLVALLLKQVYESLDFKALAKAVHNPSEPLSIFHNRFGSYVLEVQYHKTYAQVSVLDVSQRWPLLFSVPMSKAEANGYADAFAHCGYIPIRVNESKESAK